MMATPFDLDSLTITGPEAGLMSNVMQATNFLNSNSDSGAAQAAVSATGTLAYIEGGEMPDTENRLVWVDRRGHVEPLAVPPRPYGRPQVSPNGHLIAVATSQSQHRIWVHDLRVPDSLVPVTSPAITARAPVWTTDGTRLTFRASPGGQRGIFWVRADGSGSPERLMSAEGGPQPASWTPDGQLLYIQIEVATGMDIRVLFLEGGIWNSRPLLATLVVETDAQVSPDGRWLAYSSNESGRMEVYVRRFPSLEDRKMVSTDGGGNVVWEHHGRELFYVRGPSTDTNELVAHDVGPDGAIALIARPLFRLKPLRLQAGTSLPSFDVAPDGQRFVFVQSPDTVPQPPSSQIHLVFNWFEELKRLSPTGK